MFTTVLVANRGEIACRIIATLNSMGITSVAIYSEPEAQAKHVAMADTAVCVGPAAAAASYLDIEAVIHAAQTTGAQAIHPGYGFLSENVEFARACNAAGITFIGPDEHALEIMGDKIRSKKHVAEAGVPLVEGISEPGLSDDQLAEAAASMTFPVLIKPSAGGGGKGMHVAEQYDDVATTLPTARRVAKAAFGDDTLFIEQLIRSPRHIEVQILADTHGNVIHLGERECSLQRRHQKVIEEAPSALLNDKTRQRIGQAACDTARSVNYHGAGTVEFLVSDHDPETFYFMEMNTRLQVEHPVTEEVTGVDLVHQQVLIAAGEALALQQSDVVLSGHSVEARLYAEDPQSDFLPSAGTVIGLREPNGPGIRVDSGLLPGLEVGTEYDPMLAKIIATGTDRAQAFSRLHRALDQTVVHGLTTNSEFLRLLSADQDVLTGQMDTTMIERKLPELSFGQPHELHCQATARLIAHHKGLISHSQKTAQAWQLDGWRISQAQVPVLGVICRSQGAESEPHSVPIDADTSLRAGDEPGQYVLETGTRRVAVQLTLGNISDRGTEVWVSAEGFTGALAVVDNQAHTHRQLAEIEAELVQAAPEITAPMPGTVVAVDADSGNLVEPGNPLVTLEAMKMEHRMTAHTAGIARITVAVGEQVTLGQVLATIEATDEDHT